MARALLRRSITGQAITAVVFAYAALLPLRAAGWISTSTYTVAALLLSLAALVIVGNRLGRSVAKLRSELTRLTTLDTRGGLSAYVASGIPTGAQDKLYRPVERRAPKPKVSSEAAENAASRNLAQQWTRSQRIARVGSWEWQRSSNEVICSAEVFRIVGVNLAKFPQFRAHPRSMRNLVHPEDRRAFSRWIVRLTQGLAQSESDPPQGLDIRIVGHDKETRHVHVLGEAVRDTAGQVVGLAGTIQDATERTRAIQQIHRLAYFDVVTELPNRSRFHEKLAETLDGARARRHVVRDHVSRSRPVQAHQRHAGSRGRRRSVCA